MQDKHYSSIYQFRELHLYICTVLCCFLDMFLDCTKVIIFFFLNEEAEYKRAWPGQSRVRLI